MTSKTAKDLVPGDPDEIWLLADSYNRMARTWEEIGRGFRTIDDGGWSGRAAEAFRAHFEQQPKRYLAMADSYGQAATALDTYASVLAWAQRQAGEVIALGDKEDAPPNPAEPVSCTPAEQAELTGVITGTDDPQPIGIDQHELALCTYRRALAMLDTVGNESATTIMAAAELMPAPFTQPIPQAVTLTVRAVVSPQEPRTLFDPKALRDDLQSWATAIKEIRKRLRWDGLDRMSPRLPQHIFDGHYRPSRQEDTGYHHREGGVDRGALRVVEIIDGPDEHGVYVARVSGPRTAPNKVKTSTFFPDSWSRAKVLQAVRHAFRTGDYDPTSRRFRGEYEGVQIVGHLKRGPAEPRLCDVVTAYPRGVRKRPKRS
ncbi:EndoU domain-containing protein [Kibdelosporangium philippinense]|uniref:EndoU domain-containing protein n=1 Tax=Kibdelosporangium philippinense TaxID=211113 RepID=A0ABS8Z1J4_9PSEU|nr:EndoU domain-containing protein [Kibdelosporangium philippinense]MCE7001806.1 EndoU domain-containing protein [Kibdelosporangium philippinense]